ncbi:hypothetical protein ES703_78977 [subsurface metagenome]
MAIEKVYLDPEAQAYTDDEVVGKVNTATAKISRAAAVDEAALPAESATFQKVSEAETAKLAGVEDNAAADQSGEEIKTAYEAEPNAFTDAKDTKLTGVGEGAEANVGEEFSTAEQTKLTGIDAGAEVNPADLAALDEAANTKLVGIEEGAKDDQTGAEMRDAVVALPDDDRKIIITRPTTGQKKIVAIQTHSDGKQEIEQNDTPES